MSLQLYLHTTIQTCDVKFLRKHYDNKYLSALLSYSHVKSLLRRLIIHRHHAKYLLLKKVDKEYEAKILYFTEMLKEIDINIVSCVYKDTVYEIRRLTRYYLTIKSTHCRINHENIVEEFRFVCNKICTIVPPYISKLNYCVYCNCRLSKKHNQSKRHTLSMQKRCTSLFDSCKLPFEMCKTIISFLS
jgi:hypothetical protein